MLASISSKLVFLFSVAFCLSTIASAYNGLQDEHDAVFSSFANNRLNVPTTVSSQKSAPLSAESRFRLSNAVVPRLYKLFLIPTLEKDNPFGEPWTTYGNATIEVQCLTSTNVITLHAVQIRLAEVQVFDEANTRPIQVLSRGYDADNSTAFYHINLAESLFPGNTYSIFIIFESRVNVELHGMYQSKYTDPATNEIEWLITTQMEAVNAREMIPSFDEPHLKAQFDVTIARQEEYIALFNTESISNTSFVGTGIDGWVWEKFALTPVMPTYLLAIIISKFTFSQATTDNLVGKTVRTYAPKHYIDRDGGIYAADVADKMLGYFENYYGHQYNLTKMDSAAVPDFFFGAMENWGLNIYRETALLFFPDESTEAERYTVTRILGHELAHQWFGNLVTCDFWTHIWLNEGFATYVAALGVQEVDPSYEPWERFINDVVQAAMLFDARAEVTHSIRIPDLAWPTKGPMDWFDRISYEKGGSLIRMMDGILSEARLKQGLNHYLGARQYATAVQDDLFTSLNLFAQNTLPEGLTIKDIFDTWTLQPHFPLIKVSRASATSVYVSQERFINNQRLARDSTFELDPNEMWYVPLSIASEGTPNFTPAPEAWLNKNVALRSIPVEDTSKWIIFNAGATGYYRVLYDTQLTNLIRQQLNINHSAIDSAVTRSQLMDDYFHSAWQGYVSIDTTLSMTNYLGNETQIVVWNTVFTNLRQSLNLIGADLRDYLLPKIESALTLVGGATNANVGPGMPTLRHYQFLDWLCAFEGEDCKTLSSSLYTQWNNSLDQPTPVQRDIRPVIYCSIVANGGQNEFNFIKDRYLELGITAKQRGTLLNALACSRETSIIAQILEDILEDTHFVLTKPEKATLLQRLGMNANARDPTITFLREKVTDIIAYFNGTTTIVNAVSTMSAYLGTATDLEKIQALSAQVPGLAGSIQTINSNIRWIEEFGNDMKAYFAANKA